MGCTWEFFARICLLCGRNLSSGSIAKCDPKFSKRKKKMKIGKNIKDAVMLGRGRQNLENSSWTIGITAVTVNACQRNVFDLQRNRFEQTFALSFLQKGAYICKPAIILHNSNVFTWTLFRQPVKCSLRIHKKVVHRRRRFHRVPSSPKTELEDPWKRSYDKWTRASADQPVGWEF